MEKGDDNAFYLAIVAVAAGMGLLFWYTQRQEAAALAKGPSNVVTKVMTGVAVAGAKTTVAVVKNVKSNASRVTEAAYNAIKFW